MGLSVFFLSAPHAGRFAELLANAVDLNDPNIDPDSAVAGVLGKHTPDIMPFILSAIGCVAGRG